jgi:O-antigen/teichoic acid export membrane protein
VPFVALLWVLAQSFGIAGAAIAWSLRCGIDALLMLWLSGMRKGDLLPLLPSGAVLAAALVTSHFLGSSTLENFAVAALFAVAAVSVGYAFSEEWRRLIEERLNRAWVFVGNLTSRPRLFPHVNTKVQK